MMVYTTTNTKGITMTPRTYDEWEDQEMPEDTVGPVFRTLAAAMRETFDLFAEHGIDPDAEDAEEQASLAGIALGSTANSGVLRTHEGDWIAWAEGPRWGDPKAPMAQQFYIYRRPAKGDVF